jgi:hypothetical protein
LRGFFHFLRTDPRVPANVREETARFGLPKDEFTDNGNWPHQIYVREARRMVSDFVMTEHHIRNRLVAPNGISLATYPMDIHAVRRVYQDGKLYNEGFGGGGGRPAPIGYGAIVPKAAECENLLVTFALSASHAAFGSIRMEPVFMVSSQSAATAACLAIDANTSVQNVDQAKLRARLLADGQILNPPSTPATASPRKIVRAESLPGIVMDDDEAEYQGNWTASNAQPTPTDVGGRDLSQLARGRFVRRRRGDAILPFWQIRAASAAQVRRLRTAPADDSRTHQPRSRMAYGVQDGQPDRYSLRLLRAADRNRPVGNGRVPHRPEARVGRGEPEGHQLSRGE